MGAFDYSAIELLLLACAAAGAYFLKGFSGFGPALVVVPVFAIICGPHVALGTSAVLDLVVGGVFLASLGKPQIAPASFRRMAVAIAVGAAIGAVVAGLLPRRILLGLIGASVLVLALWLWRRRHADTEQPPAKRSRRLELSAGAGGISGGLVGISGPFVVAGAANLPKTHLRHILVALFLVESAVRVCVYAAVGIITTETLMIALLVAPLVLLGLVVGNLAHLRVSQAGFQAALAVMLLLIGTQATLSAWL